MCGRKKSNYIQIINDHELKINQMDEQLLEMFDDDKTAQLEKLEEELTQKTVIIEELVEKLEEKGSLLAVLEKEKSNTDQALQTLKSEFEQLKEKQASTKSLLKSKIQNLQSIHEKHNIIPSGNDSAKDYLSTTEDTCKARVNELWSEAQRVKLSEAKAVESFNKLEKENENLKITITELTEKLKIEKTETSTIIKKAYEDKLVKLENDLIESNKRIREHAAQVERERDEERILSTLQKNEIEKLSYEIASLNSSLQEHQRLKIDIEAAYQGKEEKLSILTQEKKLWVEEMERLMELYRALETDISNAKNELESLQRENKELSQQLSLKSLEFKDVERKLATAQRAAAVEPQKTCNVEIQQMISRSISLTQDIRKDSDGIDGLHKENLDRMMKMQDLIKNYGDIVQELMSHIKEVEFSATEQNLANKLLQYKDKV